MTNEDLPVWSSDVPISMPQPSENSVLVPMFGFGFTQWGLTHDLTDVEYEHLRTPSYSPELPGEDVIFDDQDT